MTAVHRINELLDHNGRVFRARLTVARRFGIPDTFRWHYANIRDALELSDTPDFPDPTDLETTEVLALAREVFARDVTVPHAQFVLARCNRHMMERLASGRTIEPVIAKLRNALVFAVSRAAA